VGAPLFCSLKGTEEERGPPPQLWHALFGSTLGYAKKAPLDPRQRMAYRGAADAKAGSRGPHSKGPANRQLFSTWGTGLAFASLGRWALRLQGEAAA
jgi:hypothetical protein